MFWKGGLDRVIEVDLKSWCDNPSGTHLRSVILVATIRVIGVNL